jgi:uncharacterized membrane protein (UPF0127 family)
MCGDFVLAQNVAYANTFLKRLKGLLFKKGIDKDFGLLIKPCKQIHTFGMKFNIDVLFLSKDCEVLEIVQGLKPGRLSVYIKESVYVLELASGVISDKIQIGGKIKLINI